LWNCFMNKPRQHVSLLTDGVRRRIFVFSHSDGGRGSAHGPDPRHPLHLHQDRTARLLLHGHYGKKLFAIIVGTHRQKRSWYDFFCLCMIFVPYFNDLWEFHVFCFIKNFIDYCILPTSSNNKFSSINSVLPFYSITLWNCKLFVEFSRTFWIV